MDRALSLLRSHHVPCHKQPHPRRRAVIVRAADWIPLSVAIRQPAAVFSVNQTYDFQQRHHLDSDIRRAVDEALSLLYLADVEIGECILQRQGKTFVAVKVHSLSINELTKSEKLALKEWKKRNDDFLSRKKPTYGLDLECLLYHKEKKKWVAASSIVGKDGAIGYDGAIFMRDKKVLHPILELRPSPAENSEKLFRHLIAVNNRFKKQLQQHGLYAVGSYKNGNRLSLGGHFHTGNLLPTQKKIAVLDRYLAFPLAAIAEPRAVTRRKRFGRLGNVKFNRFDGFEYRTPASFYDVIEKSAPLIRWFCYLVTHEHNFPVFPLSAKLLQAYYHDERDRLRNITQKLEQICCDVLPEQEVVDYARPFFTWLTELQKTNQFKLKT